MCLFIHASIPLSLSLFLVISLFIYRSIYQAVYLPVHLYITYLRLIYLPTYLRTSLSLYISISLSLYLSICLSIYLSLYPSIYLSIYLNFLYRLSNHSQPLIFCHPIYLYLVFLLCIRVFIKIRRTYLCIFLSSAFMFSSMLASLFVCMYVSRWCIAMQAKGKVAT